MPIFAVLRLVPLLLLSGCLRDDPTCEVAAPSVIVALSLPPGLVAGSVEIRLETPELARTETHPFAPEIRVPLLPRPERETPLRVTVRAFATAEVEGLPIGEGAAAAPVDPDGCNRIEVPIAALAPGDAGTPVDAGPDEADTGLPDGGEPCTPIDGETVFLHRFDDGDFADATGRHPVMPAPGATAIPGREGCGPALGFDGGHGVVPHADDFQLDAGALDFWLLLEGEPADAEGVISRDALGTTFPGHLTISRNCDDRVVVRIQGEADTTAYRCSNVPVPRGVWTHVLVNFGPPDLELFVNGELATTASVAVCGAAIIDCLTPFAGGIAGNENPWVYGASAVSSEEGMAAPLFGFLQGALDDVRLSQVRR